MNRRFTKGFTLVELIVVIAIVAILATVSIVGFQSYISRARVSNDVTDARNMTGVLQNYMTLNGLDDVDTAEIRSIVNIENDYSFEPRVEGYSFWYNESTRTIELKTSYEVMFEEDDFTELTGTSMTRLLNDEALDAPAVGDKLEEVVQGFYLLDTGGSDFADALYGIRNLKTLDEFVDALVTLNAFGVVHTHLSDNFDPEHTLYINDFFGLTANGNTDVDKVVFADGIEAIPGSALAGVTTLPAEIKLPVSVVIIEKGAFTALTGTTLKYDDLSRIQVEEGALNPADPNNAELVAKESAVNLEELTFSVNYAKEVTRAYQVTFSDGVMSETYAGKRIKTDDTTYDYYNNQGEKLTEGTEYDDLVGYFSDPTYMKITTVETDINLNLEPTLDGAPTGSIVYSVHVTYREDNTKVIAEAKGYDEDGVLFAKGTIMSLRLVTEVVLPETATITFDLNGGTGINEEMTRFVGETITEPTPTQEGFTFVGWYTDEQFNNPYTFDIMGSNDEILYAKWDSNGS